MRRTILTAATFLGLTGRAMAQAPGLPIHGAGMAPGLEVAATAGWAGSSSMTGKATTFGATVAYGWSRFGLSGTIGVLNPESGDSRASFGVLGNLRLLGGGVDTPFEVGIFGGYGKAAGDEGSCVDDCPLSLVTGGRSPWHAPVGLGASLTIPTPVVSIRPWLAPRAEIFWTEESGARETVTRFAGSVGVDFRFVGGFGVRLLWDKVDGDDQTIGAGLAYRF